MVEDLKKGQPDVNILDHKKRCSSDSEGYYSDCEGTRRTLKDLIRLRRLHQT